jgi:hypothetical protein
MRGERAPMPETTCRRSYFQQASITLREQAHELRRDIDYPDPHDRTDIGLVREGQTVPVAAAV